LQQLTAQLQKAPNDSALRERIIRLGQEIKPAPAIPEEANRREGRGKFAFRSAKSNEDFLAAAAEFEEAAKAAPWVAGYYSDLCTIYEKVEKYAEAKRNCQLYLVGLTDPAQIAEAKQRIAGIEFGIEKASSPKAREATLLAKVNGARFVRHVSPQDSGFRGIDYSEIYEIEGNSLRFVVNIRALEPGNTVHSFGTRGSHTLARLTYGDGKFTLRHPAGSLLVYTIEPDGNALLQRTLKNPSGFPANLPLPSPVRIPRQ